MLQYGAIAEGGIWVGNHSELVMKGTEGVVTAGEGPEGAEEMRAGRTTESTGEAEEECGEYRRGADQS